eukprot:TRINITY_DN15496_c0_g1_i1.p1 TRINITY_DN15496_c0_g1~~TRINITY_DN15496_c0_g1_i1.p1  ORF type:complete len:301 (+),score=52.01 TRINITY_DN15496_c0_g1_i1:84-986(+)
MELNSVLFPAPAASYSYSSHKGKLVFIPRAPASNCPSNSSPESQHISCLYIRHPHGSSKVVLYFHGNGEDLGASEGDMQELGTLLGSHVLVVEYPGYGIYSGSPSAAQIISDAVSVFDYVARECAWGEENIIVFGRSIGTGPAVELASKRKAAALILVAAYASIKRAVGGLAGEWMAGLVKQRFDNVESIKEVKCPTLIVHGKIDKIISYEQAVELKEACVNCSCDLVIRDEMPHNEESFFEDVEVPIIEFLKKHDIRTNDMAVTKTSIMFSESSYQQPTNFPKPSKPGLLSTLIYKFLP